MDYSKILSDNVKAIRSSSMDRFFGIAATMEGVISLGVGEPDFKTPWPIRKAGIETLERGRTWYSTNSGLKELKQGVCEYMARRFDLDYQLDEVIITVGGSEGIDAMVRAVVNPGEEVLIPDPSYFSYEPIIHLVGGVPVPVPLRADRGFKLDPEDLRAAITPKTKLLIFPFPGNPTGGVMRQEELEAIAQVLRGTDIMVLSDELYAELTFEGRHVSIASLEGMKERTVVINGFSKAYAMTGWRLGYACGPEPIIAEMMKIHQNATICAPTTSQYAGVVALQPECDGEIEYMVGQYDLRRKLMVAGLNAMGLTCFNPEGAFYIFPSIKSTGLTSEEFCEQLLLSEKLAVVPGNLFGAGGEGYVRISYSYSIQHLTEALARIGRFLQKLEESRA